MPILQPKQPPGHPKLLWGPNSLYSSSEPTTSMTSNVDDLCIITIHVKAYICLCTDVYVYIYMSICMYVYVCMYRYTSYIHMYSIYIHTDTCVIFLYTYIYTHMYVYLCIYIYVIYILYMYVYIYVHLWMYIFLWLPTNLMIPCWSCLMSTTCVQPVGHFIGHKGWLWPWHKLTELRWTEHAAPSFLSLAKWLSFQKKASDLCSKRWTWVTVHCRYHFAIWIHMMFVSKRAACPPTSKHENGF